MLRSLKSRIVATMALLVALVLLIAALGVTAINALNRSASHELGVVVAGGELSTALVGATATEMRAAEQYCASMAGIIYQWLVNSRMPLTAMFEQLKVDLTARLRVSDRAGKTPRRPPRARATNRGNGSRTGNTAPGG